MKTFKKIVRELAKLSGCSGCAFRLYQWLQCLNLKHLLRNRSYFSNPQNQLPIPPAILRVTVAGTSDINRFLDLGKLGAENILEVAQRHNCDLQQPGRSLLDFGCGCGRVTRNWEALANSGTRVYGCDYNDRLVSWCKNRLAFASFSTNDLKPPTRFEDSQFDCIYALSVFTHLTEPVQKLWLSEMRRLLKPGGLLLFSIHGAAYLRKLDSAQQETFRRGELVVVSDDEEGSNFCNVYHPESCLLSLANGFRVLEIIPVGAKGNPTQDLVVFKAV